MTVPNARSNTHGTLTATILTPTSTTESGSINRTSSTTHIISSTSESSKRTSSSKVVSSTSFSVNTVITTAPLPLSSFTSAPSSIDPTPTGPPGGGILPSVTLSSSSSASVSGAAAAPASSAEPVLTKPQVAGIVVASIGAATIGFGVCLLIFCLRRRKNAEKRRSSSSFGGDKIIGSEETTPDMAAIATRDFGYEHQIRQQLIPPRQQRSPTRQLRLETPASSSEDGWGHYQRDMTPEEMRLAVEPQMPRALRAEHSPITPASNRTRNSQLLPDKPTYSLFPSPLRITPRNSVPNLAVRPPGKSSPRPAVPSLGSPFARALPSHPSSVDTSQAHLQGGRGVESSGPDPFTDPSNRSPPSVYRHFQDSRPRPPPPSIRRVTPDVGVQSWEQPRSTGVVRKPLPAHQPPSVATRERSIRRKSSRKKSVSSRPITLFSNGSETSFESIEDEDDPAPEPRSTLSPVTEVKSPPTGRVSYPAIPISVAESPTRRPREKPQLPSQADSLLSKRLGQDKAREIADRLRGSPRQSGNDNGPHSARWKVLGLDQSGSPSPPKSALKSPAGQTPWRR